MGDGGRHRFGPARFGSWRTAALAAGAVLAVLALILVTLHRRDPAGPATGALDGPPPAATATTAAPTTAADATVSATPARTPTDPTVRTAPRRGTATSYGLDDLPNCSYPTAAATGTYVAVGAVEWNGSKACGTVLEVTGPKGSVRVTVTDQCPGCPPGRIALAESAFARIADRSAPSAPVTYARVVNPPVGPLRIQVEDTADEHWLALLPMDTGNPVASMQVRIGASWRAMTPTDYGYWTVEDGAGPGPFSVRVTDDRGHTATVTVPLAAGRTVATGAHLY